MRKVLAILFMSLATQAHSICFEVEDCTDEDICDKIKFTNIPRYKTEAEKRGLNCLAPDKTKTDCNADVDEKYQELMALYTKQKNKSEMISVYIEKLEKQIDEKDKSIEYLKGTEEFLRAEQKLLYDLVDSKSPMSMLQIISNNTGVENDINTALAVIQTAFNKLPRAERLEIQLVMHARGWYPYDIDGVWGPHSRVGFATYLIDDDINSRAQNPEELFKEIKSGFLIENLWRRFEEERELQRASRKVAQSSTTCAASLSRSLGSPASRSLSSSGSSSFNDTYEPFYKQMYINNELKGCLKVGSTWDCTLN